MLGIVMAVAAVVAMMRIADADGESAAKWGGITVGLIILSMMFVPLPLINVAIAFAVAFVLMMIFKNGIGG